MGLLQRRIGPFGLARKGHGKVMVKSGTFPRTGKFMLTYQGVEDPDPADVAAVRLILKPAKVTEVVPGTLEVVGKPRFIEKSASQLEDWDLSKPGRLSAPSPSQTRFSTFRR